MDKTTAVHSTSGREVPLPSSPATFAHFPPELPAMIFVSSLPEFDSVMALGCVSLTQAPLNMSHVCRSWRNIALSTPRLWSRIWFVNQLTDFSDPTIRTTLSAIREFVRRSAGCGLYINLSISFCPLYPGTQNPDLPDVIGVLNDLIAAQHRWKEVAIVIPSELWWIGLVDNRNWSLNRLTHITDLTFSLGGSSSWLSRVAALPIRTFDLDVSSALEIRQLLYKDDTERMMRLRVDEGVCLPNLKCLDARSHSTSGARAQSTILNDTLKLLRCAPSLEELYLVLPTSGVQSPGEINIVHCIPSLRKLRLRFSDTSWSQSQVQNVLRHLEFPSLIKLEIDLCDRGITQTLSDVIEMVHRSGAQIKTLRLISSGSVSHLPDNTINRLFESLPTLQEFIDEVTSDHAHLLRCLTIRTNEAVLLPDLRTLGLDLTLADVIANDFEGCLLSRSPPDGQDYPSRHYVGNTQSAKHADGSKHMSRTGTSVLSELMIRDFDENAGRSKVEGLLRNTAIANMHARGLILEVERDV